MSTSNLQKTVTVDNPPDANTEPSTTKVSDSGTATATSTGTRPEPLSASQALGGSWLSRPLIWIIGFAPHFGLVAILEVSLLDEAWYLVIATALLQFATAVVVLSFTVHLARRRTAILAMPLALLLLGITAVIQGLVGGIFAASVIGGPTHYIFRIIFWLAVQLLWSPLVITTLAQYEHRRYLIAELSLHIVAWNTNAEQGVSALRGQHVRLLETIRSSVSPAIDEIRQQFNNASAPKKQAEILGTAEQLMVLAHSVETILSTPHVTASLVLEVPEHPKRFAPIADAIRYEIRRPYGTSAVLAILLLPVLVPGMFRLGGLPALIELTLGVACSAFLFASGLQLIKLFSRKNSRSTVIQITTVHIVASIAAPLVVGAMSWEVLGHRQWVLVVLLPIGFIFAAITVSGAFGLGEANRVLVTSITQVRNRFSSFQNFVGEEEKRMSADLEALLHGPIRGRLAACIMALKFHAEELASGGSTRGEKILLAVGSHLDATAQDLDRMNVPTPLAPRAYSERVKLDD